MVEVARSKGVMNGMSPKGHDHYQKPIPMQMFWEEVEKTEVFVFAPINKSPVECPDHATFPEIDPSFAVMSIEMLGDNPITTINPRDIIKEEITICSVWCILNYEIIHEGKRGYGQFVLIENDQGYVVVSTNAMRMIVKKLLDRVSVEDDGVETTRHSIKIGTGKGKVNHRIRRIIHIKPKRKRDCLEDPCDTRTVDFSHRFVRRGHFRELPEGKIGKNRDGDYCMAGETWVNESKPIGPANKPLIKKVRFVDGQQTKDSNL
jgi:hypothetical protein